MSRSSSRSSGVTTPMTGLNILPPIITTEADRNFLNEVNAYVDRELSKVCHLDQEQRYLIYKTVFNHVIEHVTAYKPVLTSIKKEYEDTIETIKKGQREAAFLQGKLKAMASEPSTLCNYKKRADELEERMLLVKKDNEHLQKELREILTVKEEREKSPKTAEAPKRQLKKDNRFIPGLTLEDTTDMNILQKKYETLDRQLKDLTISLKARFLPKTNKLQLKKTLDNKVTYRDQLLWQSQVYKTRGQKLKIALEAAQAYNLMKPPHQTVGDAVTIAFHQASGFLSAEREKAEGEAAEAAQSTSLEDDDPNKEKEAEMMLEYIEKFNELFEDGLYEEAAVHAANSPKGILRTQATLAKFRDVKVTTRGRSPLLAFCDAMMSSVKAAGQKPNKALSIDCMEAGLVENRLDLVYHWLAQDRLTLSLDLGQMVTDHCSCLLPCKCGCQALAQHVFMRQKVHHNVILTMLKQGKIQGTLQYARQHDSVTVENIKDLLMLSSCQELVEGLLEEDLSSRKPLLGVCVGEVLLSLIELKRPEMVSSLIQAMLKPQMQNSGSTAILMSIHKAVSLDQSTSEDQWSSILESLSSSGHQGAVLQLVAVKIVVESLQQSWAIIAREEKKGVSFSSRVHLRESVDYDDGSDDDDNDPNGGDESSCGMSSRSRESTSFYRSSSESSSEISVLRKTPMVSILKKHSPVPPPSSSDSSIWKSPVLKKKKRGVRMRNISSRTTREEGQNVLPWTHREGSDHSLSQVSSHSGIRFINTDSHASDPDFVGESEAE